MSSNIQVQRICQYCHNEFTARTTTTLYCSHNCNRKAYKQKLRESKVEKSNTQTQLIKNRPAADLKAKEFLTVREVSQLLNCSVRSAYNYIDNGTIRAVNLGVRATRVKRSEIDKLFEQHSTPVDEKQNPEIDVADCYNLTEVQSKYKISEKTLHNIIKRYDIPKIKKGWFAYVPKNTIDTLLG